MEQTEREATCDVCGAMESDDTSLKFCARCNSVQYCSQACQKMAWAQHKQVCIDPVEREAVARRGPAARPVDPRGIATPNQPNRPNSAKGGHEEEEEPPPLRAMDVGSNATVAPTKSPTLVCGVAGASTSSNPPRKKRPPRDPAVVAARAADAKAAAEASAAAAAVSPPPPPFTPKQKPEGAWKVISEGESDATCGVCNEKIFAPVELKCGHQYCKACVLSLKRYDILDDELCAECRTAVPMPGMPDDLFDRGVRIVMVVQRRVELRKSDSWQNLSPELLAQMDMVREMWTEAADQDHYKAQVSLADLYADGMGVPKSDTKAVEWRRTAAEAGLPEGCHALALNYYYGEGVQKHFKLAFQWYTKAAEQGHIDSCVNIAQMYHDGEGVPQSDTMAAQWVERAADLGHAISMYNIGCIYDNGEGVPLDEDIAIRWWQRAAALEEPDALYNLAVKHDHGRGGLGVDMDHMSAFELYKKAAEAGHSGAYCNMANMYREGRGVPEDLKLAAKCFEHAAQKDVAEAQFNLALMYYHGHGVRERASVAVKWFSRAVEQDFSRAQFMLGFMYEHGEGVAKDEGEAAKLYSKAAAQEEPNSAFRLSLLYEDGRGVPYDAKKAKRWLIKAADLGDEEAQEKLDELHAAGKLRSKADLRALEGAGSEDEGDEDADDWGISVADASQGATKKNRSLGGGKGKGKKGKKGKR